jgi:acetyl esterase/lipase
VRAVLLGLTAGCSAPAEILDVSYDDRFGAATTMDVYLPAGGGDARPAVMFIHGGGWRVGSKENYTRAAIRMAESGFVAATINYRLVPDGAYPAAVQDCACALSFLRANADAYGLDPDRLAVWGYSAGGHLASIVGVAAEAPEHVPDCASGPTGLPAAVVSGAGRQDLAAEEHWWITDFLGGTPAEVPERYESASPISHVRPGLPPTLFVVGEDDAPADQEGIERMRRLLQAEGNDASLLVVSGGGHLLNPSVDGGGWELSTSDQDPVAWMASVDFLDRTIGR